MNFWQKRQKAFGWAGKGLADFFKREVHGRLHLMAASIVVALAAFIDVSKWDWLVLLVFITLVIALEMVNSALEELTDLASPEFSVQAARVKDLAAGAVLWASLMALVVAIIVFVPYFAAYFH